MKERVVKGQSSPSAHLLLLRAACPHGSIWKIEVGGCTRITTAKGQQCNADVHVHAQYK